ncbi:hypothetical protein GN958_ATG05932 [Phytophthora infestans]|uniref:Uncharacterized protein n=1 Tax=Phytophthora infestans TaxID=4787 RepID=A0A8S9UW34_PHYIN|nr:hypothetical protein GN958_ATG05932 [Phytophthora infestans]
MVSYTDMEICYVLVVRERLGVLRTHSARASWCPEDAQCESVLVSLGRTVRERLGVLRTRIWRVNCIRGAFVLLSAKLRDSSFSIDAETLVGNALIFMQSLPRCG